MFVTHLSLVDFRNYASADVALEPGVTVFVGANGQGKTNLLEALEYLATLGSHRVSAEAPLIRAGAERALVRARIQAGLEDERRLLAEIELIPGKANKAALNRSPLRRARDILGSLRVVLFSPEDLALVKGDPADRRRFVDELATARWPRLAGVRADYDKVLRQRSALLKSLAGRFAIPAEAESTLSIWDEQLARFGAEIIAARTATLSDLAPFLATAYADIAPARDAAAASYKSAGGFDAASGALEIAAALQARMLERRRDELARGVSLVGPHRDDVTLTLGEFPAKGYASHGESWSFGCALKLASFMLLREDGVEPVLLLDDVFAELDAERRERLAATALTAEQVLITAAVAADVPVALSGQRYSVRDGKVTRDPA
ncbi:MAG: DNA replication/repair protein RecF [Propionibacteriaceae bacterium]|jgi:DNA replication and repair protein RecF|nr:DNA replication/repair protein RecF [Propionibacteriaceae bacterium]